MSSPRSLTASPRNSPPRLSPRFASKSAHLRRSPARNQSSFFAKAPELSPIPDKSSSSSSASLSPIERKLLKRNQELREVTNSILHLYPPVPKSVTINTMPLIQLKDVNVNGVFIPLKIFNEFKTNIDKVLLDVLNDLKAKIIKNKNITRSIVLELNNIADNLARHNLYFGIKLKELRRIQTYTARSQAGGTQQALLALIKKIEEHLNNPSYISIANRFKFTKQREKYTKLQELLKQLLNTLSIMY